MFPWTSCRCTPSRETWIPIEFNINNLAFMPMMNGAVKTLWQRRYGNIGIQLMDRTVLIYLAALGLLVIPFHRDVALWALYPAGHAVLCFLILEFVRFSAGRSSAVLRFVRTFYPVLGIPFLWTELDNLITMLLPYWANGWIVQLDLKLFGVHPTVWMEQWFRPWLTELMNFFYALYYLFIPTVGLWLYFRGKVQQTFDFLFLVMFTFCTSYFLFLCFPSEGAWIVLKDLHRVQPEGGLFMRFIQMLQSKGSIRGGAFPSSHVDVAFVVALSGIRYVRRLGWFLLPFAMGVAVATVYCRYHHAVDSIAGIVWGGICYAAGTWILKKRDANARR